MVKSRQTCISVYLYYNLDNTKGLHYFQLKIKLVNIFQVQDSSSTSKYLQLHCLWDNRTVHCLEDLLLDSVSLETGQKKVAMAHEGQGREQNLGKQLCSLLVPLCTADKNCFAHGNSC